MSNEAAVVAKLGLAAATALWIAVDAALRRRGRAAWGRRTRDALLAALGVAGASGWWWFGAAPIWNDLHVHDTFHYYLGARYFREVGYEQLYLCGIQADREAGLDPGSRVRDLASNELVPTPGQRERAEACAQRFSPERWRAFRADVDWLRGRVSREEWLQIRADHGFNGSPVWLVGGSLLARAGGGSAAALPWLVRMDLALLAALWAGVVWGFGWRTAAVAAVFWGTNGLEGWDWSGGTLLRQDWLATLVLGLACLRRGRPFAAGALLATSAGLRLFPAVALAGVVARRGLEALRVRDTAPLRTLARFACGAALATALLGAAATAIAGPGAWRGFAANSAKLLATPLLNHVGLRPLVAYEPGAGARALERPFDIEPHAVWKRAQRERWRERRWLVLAIAAAHLVLLGRALRTQSDWSAAALATGAVPLWAALTGYYHVVLLGLALLYARRASIGVAMLALAAATRAIYSSLPYSDLPFVAMSAVEVVAIFVVTALAAGGRREDAAGGSPSPAPRPLSSPPERGT